MSLQAKIFSLFILHFSYVFLLSFKLTKVPEDIYQLDHTLSTVTVVGERRSNMSFLVSPTALMLFSQPCTTALGS